MMIFGLIRSRLKFRSIQWHWEIQLLGVELLPMSRDKRNFFGVMCRVPDFERNPMSPEHSKKAHLPSHDGHLSGKGSSRCFSDSNWSNFPQQCSATRTHQTHQHYSFKQWFNWAAGKTFKLIFFRWNNIWKHLRLEPITRFRNANSGGNFRLKA